MASERTQIKAIILSVGLFYLGKCFFLENTFEFNFWASKQQGPVLHPKDLSVFLL